MDYSNIPLTNFEILKAILKGVGIDLVISYLFYRSIFFFLLLLPLLYYYLKEQQKKKTIKERDQLKIQFKEGMICISSALNAGYSLENAIEEAIKDVKLIYPEDSYIIVELKNISNQLKMNLTVEELFSDFAVRADIEEITNFSEILSFAKRSGGNLIEIIHFFTERISAKMEVEQEIAVYMSGKRFEQKLMNIIPFFIIVYVDFTNPGFFQVLYGNFTGICVMTVSLVLYVIAFKIAEIIVRIEV